MRVFVYGSLRSGESNHAVMEGATWVGPARSSPGFRLYSLMAYPAMVRDAAWAGAVVGELYDVPESMVERLDRFEGHPELYERTLVQLSDGAQAWAYLMRPEQVLGRKPVPEGDWRAFRRASSG